MSNFGRAAGKIMNRPALIFGHWWLLFATLPSGCAGLAASGREPALTMPPALGGSKETGTTEQPSQMQESSPEVPSQTAAPPQTAGADQFCPAETAEASTPASSPAPPVSATRTSAPPPQSSPQAIDTAPELLGAEVQTIPTSAPAPRHRQITRSRHTNHRVRPARSHAPAAHRIARIEPHAVTAPIAPAAPERPALIDVRPTIAPVIAPPAPAPSQDQAPPKPEPPDGPRQEQAPSMAL